MTTKNTSYYPKMQHLTIALDGTIKATDGVVFDWKKESSIYEAHPFFEMLRGFIEDGLVDETLNFPCIHLDYDGIEKICDIAIQFSKIEVTLSIFDYTIKYHELNAIAQQRNESILKGKELVLKNKFLLQKEEFKNSFIANINHEIRTPLTSILGFIEVLENTKLDFEQSELSRIIKRESMHLNTLINDLVDMSQIEAGQLTIVQEEFLFHDLINGFAASYAVESEKRGLVFETHIDESIPEYLIGDRTRMYQILHNLLNNAFKFTTEGKISLIVTKNYQRSNKTSINFKIEDTGTGIVTEDLEHIFDRFTRFNQDKQILGTGLGLAIVKNLVDLLKGEIKVTSTPEEGSAFNLKMPFFIPVTKKSVTRKKKKYDLPTTKKKFRVLVVEDEESTQYLVMKILITHGRFFVDVAVNGQEAINAIERRNYDLVLMDLKVPELDGYKVTQMIRNNYGDIMICETPIIGFTANATESEREKCLKSGMDDFIPKPFEQEDFLYKITKQIAKHQQ